MFPFEASRTESVKMQQSLFIRREPVKTSLAGKQMGLTVLMKQEVVFTLTLVKIPKVSNPPKFQGQILTEMIFSSAWGLSSTHQTVSGIDCVFFLTLVFCCFNRPLDGADGAPWAEHGKENQIKNTQY